jgi:hypothetical protein
VQLVVGPVETPNGHQDVASRLASQGDSSEITRQPHYKQKVLEASEADTVRTVLFGHRWPDALIIGERAAESLRAEHKLVMSRRG